MIGASERHRLTRLRVAARFALRGVWVRPEALGSTFEWRAGLTERTFFRHFVDKREVLFWGAGSLQDLLVSTLDSTLDSAAPIDAVAAALEAAAALLQERREFSRQRQAVIAANTELQERELIKLASLSAALADTLHRRGVTDPAASLTAEAGIAVFKVAFERWINETNQQDFPQLIRETLDELKAVTAGNDHRP
jgi:AcrR family transcriptional regulator